MTQNYLQQSDFIAQKAYTTKHCQETISSSLIPLQDRTYNIGSPQRAINEIYAKRVYVDANSLVVGGAVLSSLGGKLSMGQGTLINGKDVEGLLSNFITFLESGNPGEVFVSRGGLDIAWNSQFCRTTTTSQLIQTGAVAAAATSGTIFFTTAFTTAPVVTMTVYGSGNNYGWITNISTTFFTWSVNTVTVDLQINWIAVGSSVV